MSQVEDRGVVQQYTRRFRQLKSQRSNYEATWEKISAVVRPDAASFTSLSNTKGRVAGADLYDSTGLHANELLAAGFFSHLTNPTKQWFVLEMENKELNDMRDVKLWLEEVSRRMYTEIHRPATGFVTACQECYLDYGAYGNCVMFVTEDARGGLSFISLPLQECYFVENDGGRVTALYRNYLRTVSQLVSRFGIDNVSKDVKKYFMDGELDKEIECLHVIEPEGNRYTSIYIDMMYNHMMSSSFFVEEPFMAARFQKTSYEVYGRGPGFTALADLQMLQQINKTVLQGAQKMVDPALIVPDNAFIEPIRLFPGAVNYMRSSAATAGVQPIQTTGTPQLGENIAEGYRQRIREIFYVNQLQLNRGPEMTATEVLQRTEENLLTLGPIMGRALTELLSPCIKRIFGLLLRAGKLPAPPDVLIGSGARLRIEYTAPMVRIQSQEMANNLMKAFQVITPLASIDPAALQVYNVEAIARALNDMYALSPSFVRTQEELDEMRAAQADAQQQQLMQANIKDMGAGFNSIASGIETLSKVQ